ncbi:hypothetical protein ACI2JA_03905 [Alkalihalobacillus sp. NPDC078783]
MTKTVTVTFNVNGVEIKTEASVPQMKDGINHDNMIVLNAKSNIKRKLGIDIYEILKAEHLDEINDMVYIDKESYVGNSSERV